MIVIHEPLVTEKSVHLAENGKYVFKVDTKTNKNEIKKEIEKSFKVHVTDVNVLFQKAKTKKRGKITGKTSRYKKAIITLKKGETIKALEVKK